MGFPRQEYWNGLSFPSPGVLLNPGVKPRSPGLQADSLLLGHQGILTFINNQMHSEHDIRSFTYFFSFILMLISRGEHYLSPGPEVETETQEHLF